MNPDEYYTYEDRAYVSPTLSRDEQMGFVNTLRNTVDKNTAQINSQTKALGTNITSNLGGLTGSKGYFSQRYQTTPVEAQMNALKATAQAKALSDLMTNYQNQAQNKYNQAYRAAKKRAAAAAAAGGNENGDSNEGEPEEFYQSNEMTLNTDDWKGSNESNITGYGMEGYEYWKNMDTGKMLKTTDPNYIKGSDGYYYNRNAIRNNYQTVRTLKNGWQDKYTNPSTGEVVFFPAHSIKGYVGF